MTANKRKTASIWKLTGVQREEKRIYDAKYREDNREKYNKYRKEDYRDRTKESFVLKNKNRLEHYGLAIVEKGKHRNVKKVLQN